jgi:hypothetical protein
LISFMHWPLYPQGKSPGTLWIDGWVDPRAGVGLRKFASWGGGGYWESVSFSHTCLLSRFMQCVVNQANVSNLQDDRRLLDNAFEGTNLIGIVFILVIFLKLICAIHILCKTWHVHRMFYEFLQLLFRTVFSKFNCSKAL